MGKREIGLGCKVRDKVSGFEGVVTAKIEYITGCVQWGVSPKAHDGKIGDTMYIDEIRLHVIGKPLNLQPAVNVELSDRKGGPVSMVSGRDHP